jgi:DNA polymerase elongation subunit (family B)
MGFYTFADKYASKIYHRYVDDDGTRQNEILQNIPLTLFVESKKRRDSTVGLMGETLNAIDFQTIGDAQDFIKEYGPLQAIHGQTSLVHQFISNQYPGDIQFDMKYIKILNFDIETAFDDSGFPVPDKALQKVLSIACKVNGDAKATVFALPPSEMDSKETDDFILNVCKTESELLQKFLDYWVEQAPDAVTGWNINGFDIPYIINRMKRVLGDSATNKLSPFSSKCRHPLQTSDRGGVYTYRILGVTILDYFQLYKKYSFETLESYRLDVVAKHELGLGKVDFSDIGNLMDLWEKDFNRYIEYNVRDISIIDDLEEKLNYLFQAFTFAYLGKIKPSEVFRTGQILG